MLPAPDGVIASHPDDTLMLIGVLMFTWVTIAGGLVMMWSQMRANKRESENVIRQREKWGTNIERDIKDMDLTQHAHEKEYKAQNERLMERDGRIFDALAKLEDVPGVLQSLKEKLDDMNEQVRRHEEVCDRRHKYINDSFAKGTATMATLTADIKGALSRIDKAEDKVDNLIAGGK